MTQTPHDESVRVPDAEQGRDAGLSIERVFSTEGVHPYDEVTWERRDVVQSNWKTGETGFEQRGVEFPESWSINASTIVTSKYFRGALDSDTREWSLRQLIDRVVGKYVTAGRDNGYFATELTAETRKDPAYNKAVLDHIPAGAWGQVQDLMGACVFLASAASTYVNGHVLAVDGGYLVR